MLLDPIENYLRQEAEKRILKPQNPFRASAMGYCIRAGCFQLLGVKEEPLQPRRLMTFDHGDLIHLYLSDLCKKALGWKFVDGVDFKDNFLEIDGEKISYHIDGAYQHACQFCGKDEIAIIEFKGLNNRSFDPLRKGDIPHEYLCQAYCYSKATDFNPIIFGLFRKETAHLVTVIFDRHQTQKIITEKFNQDPLEFARQDPITLTEITSPFDESVEGYVRERIKWLKQVKAEAKAKPDLLNLNLSYAPGADAVEDEVVKCQTGEKSAELRKEYRKQYGNPVSEAGSWLTFKTGRKILGFPCSYCGFKARCYPTATMELKGDRPVWVAP